MQINTFPVISIFILILPVYYLVPKKIRNGLLLLASLLFYSLFGLRFLAFLAVSAVLTYLAARVIHAKGRNALVSKIIFWATIAVFLGIFVFFRSGIDISIPGTNTSVLAPIGFSFYTLQALGYLIDVYKEQIPAEKNIVNYMLYVSFFATVTSGPIQRSKVFLKQIDSMETPDYSHLRHGILRLGYGLFVKNVVADTLAGAVNYAFDYYEAQTGLALLIGAVLFALQLYCDFDGYSNIALGMAETLGFRLGENFTQPYFSKSIREFWGRWHISLSQWLRDYIYIPLGGNRKGKVRTILNILITFAVSGIWHGTGLNYLVWGLLHGIYRVIETLIHPKKTGKGAGLKAGEGLPANRILSTLASVGQGVLCFIAVDFAWIFFRARTVGQALQIIQKMVTDFRPVYSMQTGMYKLGITGLQAAILAAGLLIVLTVDILRYRKVSVSGLVLRIPGVVRWGLYVSYICFMIVFYIRSYGTDASAFIYTQF